MAHANATHPAPAVSASDRIREHPEVVWPLDREFPGRSDATLHDSLVRLAPFFSPLDPADAASVQVCERQPPPERGGPGPAHPGQSEASDPVAPTRLATRINGEPERSATR